MFVRLFFAAGKKNRAGGRKIEDTVVCCVKAVHREEKHEAFSLKAPLKYCNMRDDLAFGYRVYSHPFFNAGIINPI